MTLVTLADGLERWTNHRLSDDPEYFSIRSGDVKDASEETIIVSKGRLIPVPEG